MYRSPGARRGPRAARQLSTLARERGWALRSTAAHPGFTRTNLQTAGPTMGRSRPSLMGRGLGILPSQEPRQGAEPLLFAATDPAATDGGYYGPDARFGLVGTTTEARGPAGCGTPT